MRRARVQPRIGKQSAQRTDPDRRARTFGSIVWAFDTGIGTGSLIIGAVGGAFGFRAAFLVAAALSCFSIPIFARTSRRLRLLIQM